MSHYIRSQISHRLSVITFKTQIQGNHTSSTAHLIQKHSYTRENWLGEQFLFKAIFHWVVHPGGLAIPLALTTMIKLSEFDAQSWRHEPYYKKTCPFQFILSCKWAKTFMARLNNCHCLKYFPHIMSQIWSLRYILVHLDCLGIDLRQNLQLLDPSVSMQSHMEYCYSVGHTRLRQWLIVNKHMEILEKIKHSLLWAVLHCITTIL